MGHFAKGRQARADALIPWNTCRLLAYLLDVDDLGPSAGAWTVTGATIPSGNTIRLTTGAVNGFSVGDEVEVWGVGGITNSTGIFTVTAKPTTSQLEFTASSTPTGTYTSGGYVVNLTAYTFLSEINVSGTADIAKVALSTTGRTTNNGYLDAPDGVWSSVTGDPVEMMAIVYAAATDVSTNDANETVQRLILCQTPATSGLTGLPQTPTNGNINLNFSSQGLGRV